MKKFALLLIAFSILTLSGCSTGPTAAQKERMLKPNNNYNFFGIVSSQKGTFKQSDLTSSNVSVDEVSVRDNYSGDSVSLFWGLITLQDY